MEAAWSGFVDFAASLDSEALLTVMLLVVGLGALVTAPAATRWQAELMGGSDAVKSALIVLSRIIGVLFILMGLGRLTGVS